jgi:Restriction endonuclease S subunits
MELREGYKKTEVGIIPNEWTPKTYGELFQFLTTSSFSRDELSEEGDVRCVHYGDIHTKYHQFLDFSNGFNSFIDLERGKKYPFVKDGDIIMADASEDYSGIGKSVEVKNLGDKPAISGLHTFLLRDKNGDFENGFKAYIHSMAPVKKSMDRLATGLKVYGVSKANLKTVLVPVPPPAEQKAIATALSDVDTLITNLDKLIAKKKAIKQGAMQRLLKSPAQGGQRLPGFEGEWIKVKLGDIGDCIIGLTYSPNNVRDNGTLVLRSSNIQNGRLALEDNVYVQMDIPQKLITQVGDILICVRNGSRNLIGKCLRIDERVSGESFGAFMSIYRTKYSEYISQAFQSNIIQKQIEANLGATINQITNKTLNSFEISIPEDEKEIEAIASILTDMDMEIESLEANKSKYIHIKQGMMQELLTGKTRLV